MDLDIIITPEIIQASIRAANDSVGIINESILHKITEIDVEKLERNISHLEIMVTKDWFVSNLSDVQLDIINSAIAEGREYLEQNI